VLRPLVALLGGDECGGQALNLALEFLCFVFCENGHLGCGNELGGSWVGDINVMEMYCLALIQTPHVLQCYAFV
jgi:hypothetical protein